MTSAYVVNFWPTQAELIAASGSDPGNAGIDFWLTDECIRALTYRTFGVYSATYNPDSIDLYHDTACSAVVVQFIPGATYCLTGGIDTENGGTSLNDRHWWPRIFFSSTGSPYDTRRTLRFRDDQWFIWRGDPDNKPLITQKYALTAAIAEAAAQGLELLRPEYEALSAISDWNNGTWICPCSGDSSINDGDWYPYYWYDPTFWESSLIADTSQLQFVRNALYYDAAASTGFNEYNYKYRETDPDALTAAFDWIIVTAKPAASGDWDSNITCPLIWGEEGNSDLAEPIHFFEDVGAWLNNPLPSGQTWEAKFLSHNHTTTSLLRESVAIRENDPATASPALWDSVGSSATTLGTTGVTIWNTKNNKVMLPESGIYIKIEKGQLENVKNKLTCSWNGGYNSWANGYYSYLWYMYFVGGQANYTLTAEQTVNIKFEHLKIDHFGQLSHKDDSTSAINHNLNTDYDDKGNVSSRIIRVGINGDFIVDNCDFSNLGVDHVLYHIDNIQDQERGWYRGGISATNNTIHNIVGSFATIGTGTGVCGIDDVTLSAGPYLYPNSPYVFDSNTGSKIGRSFLIMVNAPDGSRICGNSISGATQQTWQKNLGDTGGMHWNGGQGKEGHSSMSGVGEYSLVMSGNDFYDMNFNLRHPHFYIGYNHCELKHTVDHWDRTNVIMFSFPYCSHEDHLEWSTIEYNNILNTKWQIVLAEGTIADNTTKKDDFDYSGGNGVTGYGHTKGMWDGPEDWQLAERPGLASYIHFHHNTCSFRNYSNPSRVATQASKATQRQYPFYWVSNGDYHLIHDNLIIGADYANGEGYQYGTAWDGQSVSGAYAGFLQLSSAHSITAYNNRMAFCTEFLKTGYNTKSNNSVSNRSGEDWSMSSYGFDQSVNDGGFSDLEIRDNVIFQLSETFWGWRDDMGPWQETTIPDELWGTTAQSISDWGSRVDAITQGVSGAGLALKMYQDRKCNNIRINNNTLIMDKSATSWNLVYNVPPQWDSDSGYFADWAYGDAPNYEWVHWRLFYWIQTTSQTYLDTSSDHGQDSYWFDNGPAFQVKPSIFANNTFFGDDNSSMSGNKFYNFQTDKPQIPWIVWEDDPESVVENYFPSSGDGDLRHNRWDGGQDPITWFAGAATASEPALSGRMDAWRAASTAENWWIYQHPSYFYYADRGMNLGWSLNHRNPLSSDQVFYYPLLARHRNEYDYSSGEPGAGLLTVSAWLDYLNNATTGMRGGNNQTFDYVPSEYDLDYSMSNWDSFLTLKTPVGADIVNESSGGGGQPSYPLDANTGELEGTLEELHMIIDSNLIKNNNPSQFHKRIKLWIGRYLIDHPEALQAKASAFSLLNLVKLVRISERTGNNVYFNRAVEFYLNDLTKTIYKEKLKLMEDADKDVLYVSINKWMSDSKHTLNFVRGQRRKGK